MLLRILVSLVLLSSSVQATRDPNKNLALQGDDPDAVPLEVVVQVPPVPPPAPLQRQAPRRDQDRPRPNYTQAGGAVVLVATMGFILYMIWRPDRVSGRSTLPPLPTPTPDPCGNAVVMCEQLENDTTLPQGGYWINVKCGCNNRWKYVNCSSHHHTTTLMTTEKNNTLQMTTTVANNTTMSETMNLKERVLNRRTHNGSAVCDVPGPPFNETLSLNTTTFLEMVSSLVESTLPHTHDDLPPLVNATSTTE